MNDKNNIQSKNLFMNVVRSQYATALKIINDNNWLASDSALFIECCKYQPLIAINFLRINPQLASDIENFISCIKYVEMDYVAFVMTIIYIELGLKINSEIFKTAVLHKPVLAFKMLKEHGHFPLIIEIFEIVCDYVNKSNRETYNMIAAEMLRINP